MPLFEIFALGFAVGKPTAIRILENPDLREKVNP